MRFILVRHYKTVNNEQRRIMGWGDAPRADDWEADLAHIDEVIRNRDIRFDAFYSSALARSRETSRYFAEKRGCDLVHAAYELNEVNYGELFEQSKDWVEANFPQYKKDPDFVFPEGESFHQMQRRSVDFVLSLQRMHANDTLLLVAHAGVIRGLISHFLGLDFASNLKRKVSHRYVGEFVVEKGVCVYYDELGKPSGFVKDGVVEVPYRRQTGGGTGGSYVTGPERGFKEAGESAECAAVGAPSF
jgi:broad specificity phosphatase PhoE